MWEKGGIIYAFCKAKNTCGARAEEYLRLAQMEFRQPPILTDEEIAEVLKVADELAKWSADIYAYAQDEAAWEEEICRGTWEAGLQAPGQGDLSAGVG